MSYITLALDLPAKSFDDCVQLLASDPELLSVTRRHGGWLLTNAGEKNLVARAEALLAEQTICQLLQGDSYCPTEMGSTSGSTLVLKIHTDGGCDRQLCAVCMRYQGRKTFGLMPENCYAMRLVRENPELLACFYACPNDHKGKL